MKLLRSNANASTLALIALLMFAVGVFSPFITMRIALLGTVNTVSLIAGISFLRRHAVGNTMMALALSASAVGCCWRGLYWFVFKPFSKELHHDRGFSVTHDGQEAGT